jgi:hypothetical protein
VNCKYVRVIYVASARTANTSLLLAYSLLWKLVDSAVAEARQSPQSFFDPTILAFRLHVSEKFVLL